MPRGICLLLFVAALPALAAACNGAPSERIEVRIGGLVIDAEVARTPEERAQGLGGRASLRDGGGMLFVLQEEGRPGFWMKDMRFSLDFIWISRDRHVVDVTEGVPHPAAAGETLSGIQPDEPALYVLEVNAGVVREFRVQVGDAVTFEPDISAEGAPAQPAEGNLFANPGFEDGEEPWFSLSTEAWGKPFSVSQKQAHTGLNSALLELRSEEGGAARVYGVLQEVAPEEFPELLTGYYFVDRWEQGTPKQYLQVVVIVWEASNIPPEVAGQAPNHQVRYILAGVESQPTQISNARYVMVGTGEPEQGGWVHIERNMRQDFQDLWGSVPEDFTKLRILFEVRWDDRRPSDGPSAADVYYDDLYIGPADAES